MTRIALLFIGIIGLVGCAKEEPDLTSTCSGYARGEYVRNIAAHVTTQVFNAQPTGRYTIVPDRGSYSFSAVPLVVCNLPGQFQRDSLAVKVSGFYLTYPGFEFINVGALPFEITQIQLR